MTSILSSLAKAVTTELLPVLSRTASSVSAAFDVSPYEGVMAFTLAAGAATAGSSPTLTVKLTHCDTSGGSYVDVTGAAYTVVTTVAGVQKLVVNSDLLKGFVKADWTIGGTSTPTFPFGMIVEGVKKYA
jgi:hypothetical protein